MSASRDARKTVQEITAFLKERLPVDAPLGACLKFTYGDAGVVVIDGRKTPLTIHNRDEAADCSVEIEPEIHLRLLHRELDQAVAFRQGHMRISGDVAIAVRLGPLLFSVPVSGAH
jgi:putative sterol carrier protein